MGTIIYDKNNVAITRFYGGTDRGVCYQITVGWEYTQLCGDDMKKFVLAMLSHFMEGG